MTPVMLTRSDPGPAVRVASPSQSHPNQPSTRSQVKVRSTIVDELLMCELKASKIPAVGGLGAPSFCGTTTSSGVLGNAIHHPRVIYSYDPLIYSRRRGSLYSLLAFYIAGCYIALAMTMCCITCKNCYIAYSRGCYERGCYIA